MNKRKDIFTVLLGVTVALILWITTLSREKLIGTPIIYYPFHALASFPKEIQRGRLEANFLGNIILFVPIGTLVPVVTGWKKICRTAITSIGFSLLIEIIQLITSRGCFDPDDVVLNSLGTIIGFGVYWVLEKLFVKQKLDGDK